MSELVAQDLLDQCFILHSTDYIHCKWPFGKPYYTRLHNYKEIIDSFPPNSLVFPLCDGNELDQEPGISILKYLNLKGHTILGTNIEFYEISLRKSLMKQYFQSKEVPCPQGGKFREIINSFDHYPAFLKPDDMYASVGISPKSVVWNREQALAVGEELEVKFPNMLMEEYIQGKEYTVLVYGDKVLSGERKFRDDTNHYTEFGPFSEISAPDPKFIQRLNQVAYEAYRAVKGSGYGRVDIRQNPETDEFFVLEVNSIPGIFEPSSVNDILDLYGVDFVEFLKDAIFGDYLKART